MHTVTNEPLSDTPTRRPNTPRSLVCSTLRLLCMMFIASLPFPLHAIESTTTTTPLTLTAPRTLLDINPDTTATRNSEGDILPLKDGRLCLVYTRFTGGAEDHDAADLALRTSTDDGRSWSPDRILLRNEGGCNVMSVSLHRLPSGDILLFYLRKDGANGICNILVRRSSDELQTISAPMRVSSIDGYHVMNNARVTRTSSGRLIAPAVLHNCFEDRPTTDSFSNHGVPFVYYSDDSGATWKRDTTSLKAPAKTDPILQENGVIELRDGSLLMYMRTNQGSQYACESTDGGISWTKPHATSLRSPLSPATIRRIPWSGDLLCIWNDHSGLHPVAAPKKRTPFCAAVSKDDGKTWRPSALIDGNPDGWFCYTSILFHNDRALISHCAGDKTIGGLNRLRITELPRHWMDKL